MALTIPNNLPAPQPTTDGEARMRVFQIIGSDIDPTAPDAWHGNWHDALKTTAKRWTQPTQTTPAA